MTKTFQASINDFTELVRQRINLVVQETSLRIAENIVVGGKYGPGSPVDTGFFRANWVVSVNEPPVPSPALTGRRRGTNDPTGAFYQLDSSFMLKLANVKLGDRFWLSNNAVYGLPLEYGHSQQAPSPPGLARGVIAQGQAIVDAVVRDVKRQAKGTTP